LAGIVPQKGVLAFSFGEKMNTRSWIAVTEGSGFRTIYCHLDGRPEGVGRCLVANYDSLNEVRALVHIGGVKCLLDTAEATFLKAYRVRGENEPVSLRMDKAKLLNDFAKTSCEYLYLFEKDVWWVYSAHPSREWLRCASLGWRRVTSVLSSLETGEILSRRSFQEWLIERNHKREAA
jgi:hypothetical protein